MKVGPGAGCLFALYKGRGAVKSKRPFSGSGALGAHNWPAPKVNADNKSQ
jgi:hypothetical protein